MLNIFRFST